MAGEFYPIKPTEPDGLGEPEDGLDDLDTETMLHGNDPEADIHRTRRHGLKVAHQVSSSGGQFICGLIAGHVGVGAMIFGAFGWRRWPVVVGALVIGVPCLVYAWKTYKKWRAKQFYSVQLLNSLGEETGQLQKNLEYKQQVKLVEGIAKQQGKPTSMLPKQ